MPDFRKILSIDTAMFGCSVGLYDVAEQRCVTEQRQMPRGQAEVLVPMVQAVLYKAQSGFDVIDLIVVTVGPGAFTGLRLGMAAAQGFGIALEKPVVGLTTLDVLARQFFKTRKLEEGQRLCVLIETKRQDFYCGFYNRDGRADGLPQALDADEIKAQPGHVVYIGDALERFGEGEAGFELPDPCLMATMGLEKFEREGASDIAPLYLRGADVSKSKKQQRTILEN